MPMHAVHAALKNDLRNPFFREHKSHTSPLILQLKCRGGSILDNAAKGSMWWKMDPLPAAKVEIRTGFGYPQLNLGNKFARFTSSNHPNPLRQPKKNLTIYQNIQLFHETTFSLSMRFDRLWEFCCPSLAGDSHQTLEVMLLSHGEQQRDGLAVHLGQRPKIIQRKWWEGWRFPPVFLVALSK